jgi:broad specificity phosphatase PhoE
MSTLNNARRFASTRKNLPPGTTPPVNVLKKKGVLNQFANRLRGFVPSETPNAYTSKSGNLGEIYPQTHEGIQGINPLHDTPIFEIIFVRHGESCANAIQKAPGLVSQLTGLVTHKQYLDPELTTKGKLLSIKKYKNLREAFTTEPFQKGQYTIGSSPLLRAQETAYYMLAKHVKKPVNVMPYLGETGNISIGTIGDDNRDMPKEDQDVYLSETTNKEEYPFQRGKDIRAPPNFEKFWQWATSEGIRDGWFFQGTDKVYRAIIFSHSNTLKEEFPMKKERCKNLNKIEIKPEGDKLGNNDFLVTLYNPVAGKQYLHPELEHKQWWYYDTRSVTLDPDVTCGLDRRCRRAAVSITKPCVRVGGKRKTRRLPKGLLRLRRGRLSRRFKK